jgi:hypothetical protein
MTQPLFGAALSSRLPEEDFTHFTWLAFFALFVENLELILALDTAHRAAGQYPIAPPSTCPLASGTPRRSGRCLG